MENVEYLSRPNVAINLLNTFPNVRIRLMVGIGGGVPSQKHDIYLVDIVAIVMGQVVCSSTNAMSSGQTKYL